MKIPLLTLNLAGVLNIVVIYALMKKFVKHTGLVFLIITAILHSCKKEEVPIVKTSAITDITGTTATCGGTITNEGSGAVLIRGVCWSTTPAPTIENNKTSDGAGAGSFISNISDLNHATSYYATAYATNSAGTGYGMAMSFTTLGVRYYNFVCDGNSLTEGYGSTGGNTYPKQLYDKFMSENSVSITYTSFGVSGQTLTQMEADAKTQIDPLLSTNYKVLIAWGGVNDFGLEPATTKETIYARYVIYCTNRKTAGWKVYALTMLPQSSYARGGFDAERLWFNNQVKTNLSTIVDGIIDVAGDTRIGDSGDELDVTYYTSDKIHLNNTGYGIIASLVYAGIKDGMMY
jgi:lysophospholipase L1-like esterase